MNPISSEAAAGDAGTRPRRRWGRIGFLILGLAVAAVGGGFLWFVHQVQAEEGVAVRDADGIVALTGGPFRINDALDLLAAGRGKRLLISGVNPATRPVEISRLVPEHQRWFACCVDIDHSATNTFGNAVQTGRWAKARGFQSLIVVTANFHMPRALAVLEHELPDVVLVPYPVVSDKVRIEAWWKNPETARLLFLEYSKYIVVKVRIWLRLSFE